MNTGRCYLGCKNPLHKKYMNNSWYYCNEDVKTTDGYSQRTYKITGSTINSCFAGFNISRCDVRNNGNYCLKYAYAKH